MPCKLFCMASIPPNLPVNALTLSRNPWSKSREVDAHPRKGAGQKDHTRHVGLGWFGPVGELELGEFARNDKKENCN